MKHLKLFFLLTSLIVLFSCQKEPIPKPLPEAGYPKTYSPLTVSEWFQRNSEFQEINIYEGLSIDKYGFLSGKLQINPVDTISKEFVIDNIDSIISRYRKFMGIPDDIIFNYNNQILFDAPYIIPFGRIEIKRLFEDKEKHKEDWKNMIENNNYKFYIQQNRVNDKYLREVELTFEFNIHNGSIEITGFWILNAKTPSNPIYSEEEAFLIARDEVKKRKGRDILETKNNFNTYPLMLKIINGEIIEIRDCWCVNTVEPPYAGYTIAVYIDTQTGKVVRYNNES